MTRMTFVLLAGLMGLALQAPAATRSRPKEPPPPVLVTGSVSRIVDGDTLWLKTAADDKPVVVRIEGIDAPEICQPGGKEAAAWLADLVLNRSVTVKPVATDDWGRTVGKVFDGSRDIGDRMVRDGQAWSTRYKYDRGPYVAEERMAKSLKRGLHATEGAIEPREFRRRHGDCPGQGQAPTSSGPAQVATVAAPTVPTDATVKAGLRCDGRRYCSQMTSCDEAKWFLKNCPGMKMDGNHDGVPCEQQWCQR